MELLQRRQIPPNLNIRGLKGICKGKLLSILKPIQSQQFPMTIILPSPPEHVLIQMMACILTYLNQFGHQYVSAIRMEGKWGYSPFKGITRVYEIVEWCPHRKTYYETGVFYTFMGAYSDSAVNTMLVWFDRGDLRGRDPVRDEEFGIGIKNRFQHILKSPFGLGAVALLQNPFTAGWAKLPLLPRNPSEAEGLRNTVNDMAIFAAQKFEDVGARLVFRPHL